MTHPYPHSQPPLHSALSRRSWWSAHERRPLFVTWAVFLVLCGILMASIFVLNDGHFSYTLDDPYIHLALAENIAHGHYGINMSEVSAPASSILWPILLAPVANLPFGQFIPLFINIAASLGTIAVFAVIIDAALLPLASTKKIQITILTLLFLVVVTNIPALAFTGMEHSLQVFLAAGVVVGLIHERQTQRIPWWLVVSIVLGPLVRYENLFLVGPALIYLLWRKHFLVALLTGMILAAVLGAFSLFLYSAGLGILPTSVLAKSNALSSNGWSDTLGDNLGHNLLSREGNLLVVGMLVLLLNKRTEHRYIAIWMTVALGIHLVLGKFNGFSRYEIYIWTTMILVIFYIYGASLWENILVGSSIRSTIAATIFLFVVSISYVYALLKTPMASNNIYEQQYQMRRFVVEYYKQPVAITDLGWVSYQNEQYVLDLWGLGSLQALQQRHNKDSTWMDNLARQHNVQLAMIYHTNFASLPANWIPIGYLYLDKPTITPASNIVSFFALNTSTAQAVKPLLRNFQATLPADVQFLWNESTH